MRFICAVLGYLTGKSNVKCTECKNLDTQNKCYGHQMPQEILSKTISCGAWKKK
jgi:hypothetical protein